MRAYRASDDRSEGLPLPIDAPGSLRVEVVGMADRCVVVLKVSGEVDAVSGDLLRSRLAEASELAARVVVDLSEVTFMDSAGLKVLVGAYRSGGQNSEAIVLRSPSPMVARVLNITRLDDLFTIEPADRSDPAHGC